MRPYIISLLALCISVASFGLSISKASTAADETTQIVADQNAGLVRIILNGEEKARLDAHGFHIKNDLTYGGQVVDVGVAGYPGVGLYTGGGDETPRKSR